MSVSTICRSTRHFYFNYHPADSSLLPHHSDFTRRVQFALRLLVTFLLCGFLGYATPLRTQLVHLYMIPNIGMLSLQQTFGCTLSNQLQITSIIVPVAIFLFIVQTMGLSFHDYVAGELLMLVVSFCISYQCRQLQTRKICLWFNVIFFTSIINQETVPSTFVFRLLASFLLAMAVALFVSLLIFPLLATFDVENRFDYCLLRLDQMQTLIIEVFLSEDPAAAKVSLARAAVVERRLRQAVLDMRSRLNETHHEPTNFLQWLFNRRRVRIINLTVHEQEEMITLLMFHIGTLQAMVQECRFNSYHNDMVNELEAKFSEFTSCQSMTILGLISAAPITIVEFTDRLASLQAALHSLNLSYQQVRLHQIEDLLESGRKIQSDDHLSHALFFFQLRAIVQVLSQVTAAKQPTKRKRWKDLLKCSLQFDWSRTLSAGKSTLIVGIGSIFVMVPDLADTFANGQWILIALCMTQGDTVGGAFTTMKMRFMGTLFGSMYAYVIFLAVGADVYKIFAMLVPWLLLFGYFRLWSAWNYTAAVAASTPILINLGRLNANDLLHVNYAILRIRDNIIGIALGVVLTLGILPVFAVDLLKSNIHDTLDAIRRGAQSMHSSYDQFFEHQHSSAIMIDLDRQQEVQSFFAAERTRFYQLISEQRTLVDYASQEPSLPWFNRGYSLKCYMTLMQHQLDVFRILQSMSFTLAYMNECAVSLKVQVEDLRLNAAGGLFLPDLHAELVMFTGQLCNCIDLWSSYFIHARTTHRRQKRVKGDLSENRRSLTELHRTVLRLHSQHQQTFDRLQDYYLEQSTQGERPSSFIPYVNSEQAESIFVAISATYYSTTQLAQAALALGTTIQTIFELETTNAYRKF